MITNLIWFAARKSPIIATAAAAVWVGKKIYNHLMERHVQALDSSDVKEKFPETEMFTVLKYDYSDDKSYFEKFSFSKGVDENGVHHNSYFDFEGVLFTLKKYAKSKDTEYEVCIDFYSYFRMIEETEDSTIIQQFATDFVKTLNLKEDNIVFIDDSIQKSFVTWKKLLKYSESQENT